MGIYPTFSDKPFWPTDESGAIDSDTGHGAFQKPNIFAKRWILHLWNVKNHALDLVDQHYPH